MPWPWLSFSKQIWIRSFKWGTVHSCRSRGCKNIRGQSWRSKKICQSSRTAGASVSNLAESAIPHWPPTLTSDIFSASWPTRKYSTSFERSDSCLFGEWKPRPWHDFEHDLWSLKVPSFHIIQRPLLKQKLPALYLSQLTWCWLLWGKNAFLQNIYFGNTDQKRLQKSLHTNMNIRFL